MSRSENSLASSMLIQADQQMGDTEQAKHHAARLKQQLQHHLLSALAQQHVVQLELD
ncbi:hypothetical protein J5X98_08440 [Leptothermofonsia sichuanensis E412]|uniref:hypothetical protein n=1 Tax=Leptothermofonsia sichuanensis TaxID=2917832 RepID=UPI001CA6D31F|nr:hypothetical protein [Leptothermofonsia sichuanensis]QZZ22392.1 hypothetical protein J5X98_08440 [Leptothermofonsia sichuanensis E412]